MHNCIFGILNPEILKHRLMENKINGNIIVFKIDCSDFIRISIANEKLIVINRDVNRMTKRLFIGAAYAELDSVMLNGVIDYCMRIRHCKPEVGAVCNG